MRKVWMVLAVTSGLLLVGGGSALAQGAGQNAEKIGKGSAESVDGLSGMYTDLVNNPTFGKFVGWAIAIAAVLLVLRLMGLRRG